MVKDASQCMDIGIRAAMLFRALELNLLTDAAKSADIADQRGYFIGFPDKINLTLHRRYL